MPPAFDLRRRLAAEAIGTTALLAVVVGSGVMAEGLAGGPNALALLANALATAAILFVLIETLGPISGAHFNPVVTLVMALRGAVRPGDAGLYVLVQTAAAVAGVWLAHLLFDLPVLQVSDHVRDGPGRLLSEPVAAFGLVAVILAGSRFRPGAVGALVGLYIGAGYWFTASTAFANPAVTLARMLTDTFAGIAPASAPAFIVGQVAGALAALAVWRWLVPDPEPCP